MKLCPSVFSVVDEQVIAGRGTAKVVVKPPGLPIPERGDVVVLDGVRVIVKRVEYLSQFRSMQELVAQELRLGLFVKPVSSEEAGEIPIKKDPESIPLELRWYVILSVDCLTKRVKNAWVGAPIEPPAGIVYLPLGPGFEQRVDAINALERKELVWLGEVSRTMGGRFYRGEMP